MGRWMFWGGLTFVSQFIMFSGLAIIFLFSGEMTYDGSGIRSIDCQRACKRHNFRVITHLPEDRIDCVCEKNWRDYDSTFRNWVSIDGFRFWLWDNVSNFIPHNGNRSR